MTICRIHIDKTWEAWLDTDNHTISVTRAPIKLNIDGTCFSSITEAYDPMIPLRFQTKDFLPEPERPPYPVVVPKDNKPGYKWCLKQMRKMGR